MAILKEYESGRTAKELSRKYGFHYQTLHDWKKKFGGITSTKELQKIKELESENNRLKKMLANLSLEHEALKMYFQKSCEACHKKGSGCLSGFRISDKHPVGV